MKHLTMKKNCGKGVNHIFISSITCRKNKLLDRNLKRSFELVKKWMYLCADNENILLRYMWSDGIHFLESGGARKSRHFIYFSISLC